MLWLLTACGMPLRFDVEGNTATMTGDLTMRAPKRIEQLLEDYPDLEWIELLDCPGSLDDVAALKASRLIREAGINTRVPSQGEIASGAVDFFIAGVVREVQEGGKVGVHSWSDGSLEGKDLAQDHPDHDLYLDYYTEMGLSEDFYWFTLNAASSSGIHWMTQEDLLSHGLITNEE